MFLGLLKFCSESFSSLSSEQRLDLIGPSLERRAGFDTPCGVMGRLNSLLPCDVTPLSRDIISGNDVKSEKLDVSRLCGFPIPPMPDAAGKMYNMPLLNVKREDSAEDLRVSRDNNNIDNLADRRGSDSIHQNCRNNNASPRQTQTDRDSAAAVTAASVQGFSVHDEDSCEKVDVVSYEAAASLPLLVDDTTFNVRRNTAECDESADTNAKLSLSYDKTSDSNSQPSGFVTAGPTLLTRDSATSPVPPSPTHSSTSARKSSSTSPSSSPSPSPSHAQIIDRVVHDVVRGPDNDTVGDSEVNVN